MNIAHSRYFEELIGITEEVERLALRASTPEAEPLRRRMSDARERVERDAPLRIAIIGEFSSGKSSLISALTGLEIRIDADVCTTETCEYTWHGLTLVDTPGVQAQENDTDHDKIAREATIEADLVLFIITNELFSPRLAKHLRYVLDEDGLGLAAKTALIVNKIDRETNPDETLRGELQKALGPYQDVPVYFCSASDYRMATELPADLQARFVEQSRVSELIRGIDQFVDDAQASGRLTTPLQTISEVLEVLQASLTPSDLDKKRLEIVRRQRNALRDLQNRLLDIRKAWKQRAYSKFFNCTDQAVKDINDLTTDKDLERLFELGMKHAITELDGLLDDVTADVSRAMEEARAKLDEIGSSPLSQEVEASTKRGATVSVAFDSHGPGGTIFAAKLAKATVKPIQEGLELAAKNADGLRNIVYKIGKQMGKKFRPNEAKKAGEALAKLAGRTGKAVPYLAAALDLYLQHREENKKGEQARLLAQMRLSMRNAFADQARLEAESLEAGIVAISERPVSDALAKLDAEQAAIATKDSQVAQIAQEVASVSARCTRLRNLIVRGVAGEPQRAERGASRPDTGQPVSVV